MPAPNPLGWLIVTWLLFWPIGIWATVGAFVKIAPAWFQGDRHGAARHARTVKRLGITALVVWAVLTAGFIALVLFAGFTDKCGSASYVASHAAECTD